VNVTDLLTDAFGRLPQLVRGAVEGLTPEQLTAAPKPGANTVGWLVWHLARIQDAQVAPLIGEEQLWATGDFAASFGLAPDPGNHGYGHTAEDVASVRPRDAKALVDYFDAVHERTMRYLPTLTEKELDRVVDEAWDPPVTVGVRLISVYNDDAEHAGQAAYVRGLIV
jgi:uncharacterized damage-inducible protein DinB